MSAKVSLRNKKLLTGFAFAVMSVSIAALLVWSFIIPNYRPTLRRGEVYGIDVSNHQKSLDWTRVAKDEIAFAYIKATEGSGAQDRSFRKHWQGARRAGLKTGAYHYFSLCSPGKSQAENFIRNIPDDGQMLPPALDLEFSPFCKNQPNREYVLKEIDDFMRLVAARIHRETILYVGDDFDRTYQIKEHYKDAIFWQLRYMLRPHDSRDYIWQVGGFFNVDGAKGKVDLNLGRIDDL